MDDYKVTFVEEGISADERLIVIVEDHEIVRSGLNKVINGVLTDCWVKVLEAETLTQAKNLLAIENAAPDLIVLDVNLPDASGPEAIECLRSDWNNFPVVVMSACDDWELAADFLKAGALGFIPKSSNVSIMVTALKLILAGGRYFPPQVFDVLANKSENELDCSKPREPSVKPNAHGGELSPRQKEVRDLMLKGRSNKEIARELGVSVGTAKNYVAAILRAYNASSRAKAMFAAQEEVEKERES